MARWALARLLLLGCLLALFMTLPARASTFRDIGDLDGRAVFSFAIMSDNKGDSPYSKREFAQMVKWINESGDAFVIGLGDHVKKGWRNDFLDFIHENTWWHRWFYPTVADGENEYYGKGQGDWGAGAPILDEVEMSSRPNVTLRKNGAEYYARVEVKGYTVHIIEVAYSDTPKDPSVAFTEDSRRYLISTLEGIQKGDKDIIILCAHSPGSWIQVLSPERRRIVMEKADLVLSASSHYYQRIVPPGYGYTGALCLNTGSITYPSLDCPYGYLEVHVLGNPTRIVTQYQDARRENRTLRCGRFSYVKEIGGVIVRDVCSYQAGLPTSWPVDPEASPSQVLQGHYVKVSVRVATRSEDVTPRVSVDLSPFGKGPFTLLDDGTEGDMVAGDGIYTGNIPIPRTASLGQHVLTLSVEDRGYCANVTVSVRVLPVSDYPIYSDDVHGGWVLEPSGRVELDPTSPDDPYDGVACQMISANAGGGIRYRYSPQGGLSTAGFSSFAFELKPVVFPSEKVFLQLAGSGGSRTTSFADLGMPLATGKWNEIEIPFSRFGLMNTNLAYVRIYSTAPSSFYIDDVRLVSSVEEDWAPTVALTLSIAIGLVTRSRRSRIAIEETLS